MAKNPPLIAYMGNPSVLAHCLRSSIAQGGARDVIEARAFLTACSRRFESTNETDARHMRDAWSLIETTTTEGQTPMATTKTTRPPRPYVAPDERTTLTKSLHTVKVVSLLAVHLLTNCEGSKAKGSATACREALRILKMRDDWDADTDDTMRKAIAATDELMEARK